MTTIIKRTAITCDLGDLLKLSPRLSQTEGLGDSSVYSAGLGLCAFFCVPYFRACWVVAGFRSRFGWCLVDAVFELVSARDARHLVVLQLLRFSAWLRCEKIDVRLFWVVRSFRAERLQDGAANGKAKGYFQFVGDRAW